MCGGYNPNIALSTHLGSRPQWDADLDAFTAGTLPAGMAVVGAAAGEFTLAGALKHGAAAGLEAARALGFSATSAPKFSVAEEVPASNKLMVAPHGGAKAFVDFQNDVTRADIELAAREGFRGAEHLKRYTTLGMATDQGKSSALNGHALMAAFTGRATADLGTIGARPPYTPVAIGALAGAHRGSMYRPVRLTPGHEWARAAGASFVESGEWLRAQWFNAPGDKDWFDSVVREVKGVRSSVGICDVSTLGKIDVQGRDAAAFLDRIYANLISTLPIGKVRYGLMLREDGMVFDDGTAARFAEDHYVLSTTTANASRVMQHLEFARQVLWPTLDVQLASVTDQWAQFAIAGPRSRELLAEFLKDAFDCSNAALPYLGCAEFAWCGRSARLYRVSFSGELAYEIAVPAGAAEQCLNDLKQAGAPFGLIPYGLEALGVMRIEKGHAAGSELNGTTTARDLGLGKLMSGKKDYIGRVLAERPGLIDPNRAVLVGVKPANAASRLHAGAHFLTLRALPTLENDQGFMSSVGYSPSLGHWIGLGFLNRGASRVGERMLAHDPVRSGDTEIEITAPCFYDPDGERLRS
jgi:sarcosine oxidase subunit alpha